MPTLRINQSHLGQTVLTNGTLNSLRYEQDQPMGPAPAPACSPWLTMA
jgi:hypothetical protein